VKLKKITAFLFLTCAGVAHAADPAFKTEPLFITNTTFTTALGYGNNSNAMLSPRGSLFLAISTRSPRNIQAIELVRARGKWPMSMGFDTLFIEDGADAQVAPAVAWDGKKFGHVVWSGGVPRQIHYAMITEAPLAVIKATQPFTVDGEAVTPAVAVTKDGTVHVAWEARGPKRIGYATLSPTGRWSQPQLLDSEISQFRPVLLARGNRLYILCDGEVEGRNQIFLGQMEQDRFSGWTALAPSKLDQRHAAGAFDGGGQLHVAWREGSNETLSFIGYTVGRIDGVWTTAVALGDRARYASSPSIAVNKKSVFVTWVAWDPGFVNSNSQRDNAFPDDNEFVEGELMFATRFIGAGGFLPSQPLTGGTCAYPRLVQHVPATLSGPVAVWSSGQSCAPNDCVPLYFGTILPR
jgi:hypothetical protein